jgi:NAD(P)H-hydrate epimerase
MKYVSVSEMVSIEKEADSKGHTYADMMEHAGRGLAVIVNETYGHLDNKNAIGLVGSGNNGGDTLVAFAYLQTWGWKTIAYIIRPRPQDDPLVERAKSAGCEFTFVNNDTNFKKLDSIIDSSAVLLDGVLGTGIRLPLRGKVAEVLDFVRIKIKNLEYPPAVVAVDCPSGIDCDSGDSALESLPADITVTMAAVKQGILKFPAYNLVGELHCVDIGLPADLDTFHAINREVIQSDWVRHILPSRPLDAHKSTFGVVMVMAGSINYSGAVILAGEAAFRSGAGWVTLAVPKSLHTSLAGSFVEATWLPLPEDDGWIAFEANKVVLRNLDKVNTLLIGPGFGLKASTGKCLEGIISESKARIPPLVIDADGLKLLARIPEWDHKLPEMSILTPHPGEMSVLTGLPISEIKSNKIKTAEDYAHLWGHVIVLKGAFTVVASPDGRTGIIPVASPALARAGTGDVLAGLIAGMRGQGMDPFDAAAAGAWIHARAGLRASELIGSTASVLAGDVLAAIMDVIADFQ